MSDNTHNHDMTLVIGGTGKTGRRVAERLRAGGRPVRIGSRSAERPFDWHDEATWPAAIAGIASVYVTYYPDIAVPGADEHIRSFTDVAVEAGARRLVLLSGRGEPAAQRCELIVQRPELDWTCVQASMFAQDFSEYFLLELVRSGVVAFPAGNVAEPFVDVEDIADVVTAAMTEDGHAGRVYEVTGPRLLTFAEAVAEIGMAAGREVRYVPISAEEYESAMIEAGAPADDAAFLAELFGFIFDGHNAHLADGVQRALGREPRDFSDFARDAAATGVWSPGGRR